MNYKVHHKEDLYFILCIIFSALVYIYLISVFFAFVTISSKLGFYALKSLFLVIAYVALAVIYFVFAHGILIGFLRNNGIKVSEAQFPDINQILEEQSKIIGFRKTPELYVIQSGGVLNAFATRFWGRNVVVVYSEVLEAAYEEGIEAVKFIIAHELGHLKRFHRTRQVFLFPANILPPLMMAYKRGCEYTCDLIGAEIAPNGAKQGLLILAAGKKLHSRVNLTDYVAQGTSHKGFWSFIAECFSSHPPLPKRLKHLNIG